MKTNVVAVRTSAVDSVADPTRIERTDAPPCERRNTIVLIAHQVLFRIAWIFKTESVLIPAFLDSISSSGWVLGMLPPLNRLGQSITPLFLARRLAETPVKSHWLPRTTLLMGVPFVCLGGLLLWSPDGLQHWLPVVFLSLYGIFFCISGLNQAVFNTVQGKLISAHRRGRLVAIAGYCGSPVAVLAAWFIMQPWVTQSPPAFAHIFLFTGSMFVAAGIAARLLMEATDSGRSVVRPHPLRDALTCLRDDAHLRRFCLLCSLVACSMLIFPHYQQIGRYTTGYTGQMLMVWVICQNLGAALFSWLAGRIADRRGTRSALRVLSAANVLCPLFPLLLRWIDRADLYWLTFVWLGTLPVLFRMQANYVLELTDRARHPIYLSTTVLCAAPPILLAPLIGEAVEHIGYTIPFCAVAAISFCAWAMTLFMIEPRKSQPFGVSAR